MNQPDIYERLLAALHQPSKRVETPDVTVTTLSSVHPTQQAPQPSSKSRNRSTPYFGFQSFSI